MSNDLITSPKGEHDRDALTTNIAGIRNLAFKPMEYSARVTRNSPAAIVIMIDQSGSMATAYQNGICRAQTVVNIVNELLQDLLFKCQKENGVKNYFNIMVFGYGEKINLLWESDLKDKKWVIVQDLKDNIIDIHRDEAERITPFGVKKYIKERYKWISKNSTGKSTKMKEAFKYCQSALEEWTLINEDSFPPMVFNITDGKPTDIGNDFDLWLSTCKSLTSTGTKDGNTLLFNILLTPGNELIMPTVTQSETIVDTYYRAMLLGSSELPVAMRPIAARVFENQKLLNEMTRCLIINSTPSSILGMLNIGTNTIINNVRE